MRQQREDNGGGQRVEVDVLVHTTLLPYWESQNRAQVEKLLQKQERDMQRPKEIQKTRTALATKNSTNPKSKNTGRMFLTQSTHNIDYYPDGKTATSLAATFAMSTGKRSQEISQKKKVPGIYTMTASGGRWGDDDST